MATPFDRLRDAYAITCGNSLVPGAGTYTVGAIALVMPDEASANEWVTDNREAIESLDRGLPGIVRVDDPWLFMRRAAGDGLAGIESPDHAMPERFPFMVRVEEAGEPLPTVLASLDAGGSWRDCLTRSGVRRLAHAEVLHWERYDILDRVSGEWGQFCPFRTWNHGDLLYELGDEGMHLLVGVVPLLGDWNSPDGAFAFFTSEDEANSFLKGHLYGGHNRTWEAPGMFDAGLSGIVDAGLSSAGRLRPRPVPDLLTTLMKLSDVMPFAAWCINPVGHREDAGCGRFVDAGKATYTMSTVAGIWKLLPDNVFVLDKPLAPWSGHDTIRWSKGQSLQLTPLDRSFADERCPGSAEGLTQTEIDEQISHEFGSVNVEKSYRRIDAEFDAVAFDRFYVSCWDAVTGDRPEPPWSFASFCEALGHLSAYERELDRHHRVHGAELPYHVGLSGSGDAAHEDLRSERFQLGLHRIRGRLAERRYKPSDAADLVALCNGTLRTLHVDFAGFAKDLFWTASQDALEELCDDLDLDFDEATNWRSAAEPPLDKHGEELVVDRMGKEAWECLHPNSRHFLATALITLQHQGHAPQLDYAPISIEIVKALEVEVGELFARFRETVGTQELGFEADHREEAVLSRFLAGSKAPTLGNALYLLRPRKGKASQLSAAFSAFLQTLPNAGFLTSKRFADDGLNRVVHKFRNGGAHDSPIDEATCLNCVDALIGSVPEPGFISRVAAWRSRGVQKH